MTFDRDQIEARLALNLIASAQMPQIALGALEVVLEVAANDDGTYDITFNEKLVGSRIPEGWLDEELCAKMGYCGEELAAIRRQLEESGRAVVIL